MKAVLYIDTNYRITKNGFPIYVIISHSRNRKRKAIAHSFLEDWNQETNLPHKNHPDYYEIFNLITEYKNKINKANYQNLSFSEAVSFLFGDAIKTSVFYTAGLKYCDASSTGRINKTVLNSFNKYFPDILTQNITPTIVTRYKNDLLKKNSPNGVHTYLRKLSTLFSRISEDKNPFKGIRPKKTPTKSKALNISDVKKLIYTRSLVHKYDGKNDTNTINYPRYYWLLLFYLGGIDFIDLANLRYDKHVHDGRIQFTRFKGQTEVSINNKIFPEAAAILKNFNCKPYLIPAYKNKDYKKFVDRVNQNLYNRTADLQLSKKPVTKSARYSFITRAQQLLIDERITVEIVGHTQQKVHSIYTDEFPLEVRDQAHKKIISL